MGIQDHTYKKHLGWLRDEETQGCKGCGDSSSHKYPEWMTRDCLPVVVPDQWESDSLNLKKLPDSIPEEDLRYI